MLTAHELGHTLGAGHTCCINSCRYKDSTCSFRDGDKCNPIDGKYIMYPYITTGKNSDKFSVCSKIQIKRYMNTELHKTECFYNYYTSSYAYNTKSTFITLFLLSIVGLIIF